MILQGLLLGLPNVSALRRIKLTYFLTSQHLFVIQNCEIALRAIGVRSRLDPDQYNSYLHLLMQYHWYPINVFMKNTGN